MVLHDDTEIRLSRHAFSCTRQIASEQELRGGSTVGQPVQSQDTRASVKESIKWQQAEVDVSDDITKIAYREVV